MAAAMAGAPPGAPSFLPLDEIEARLLRFREIPYHSSRTDQLAEREHVSASSLKTAMRCLEQYRLRYVLGLKEPPAGALLWGRAHHTAFERTFSEKLRTGAYISIDDVKELYAVNIDTLVDDSGGASSVNWGDSKEWKGLAPADAHARVKDKGVELAGLYRAEACPRLEPTHVERAFAIDVPGLPVPVTGQIDLEALVRNPLDVVVADALDQDVPGEERIIDQKTSGRDSLGGENLFQGFVYQLERPLPVDFHLSLKTKTPKVVLDKYQAPVVPTRRTVAMIQRTMLEIVTAYDVFGPDEPWHDAIRDPWACGYCGFGPNQADICRWWKKDGWT